MCGRPHSWHAAWTWAGPQESHGGPLSHMEARAPVISAPPRAAANWEKAGPTRHHGNRTPGEEEKEARLPSSVQGQHHKPHGAFPRHGFPRRAQPPPQKTWGGLKGADETAILALSDPLTADGDRVGKNQLLLQMPISQIRLACKYRKNSLKHLEGKGRICKKKITAP